MTHEAIVRTVVRLICHTFFASARRRETVRVVTPSFEACCLMVRCWMPSRLDTRVRFGTSTLPSRLAERGEEVRLSVPHGEGCCGVTGPLQLV
jgi:hypothetical protein